MKRDIIRHAKKHRRHFLFYTCGHGSERIVLFILTFFKEFPFDFKRNQNGSSTRLVKANGGIWKFMEKTKKFVELLPFAKICLRIIRRRITSLDHLHSRQQQVNNYKTRLFKKTNERTRLESVRRRCSVFVDCRWWNIIFDTRLEKKIPSEEAPRLENNHQNTHTQSF